MKLHIDTAPVWEAYRTDCECPLCLLKRKVESAGVEYFLGESVMEPDQRIEVNQMGFCRHHFKQMYDVGNRLGLALMTDTHMRETLRRLRENVKQMKLAADGEASKPFIRRVVGRKGGGLDECAEVILGMERRCVLCERIRGNMERYIYTLLHLYKTDAGFASTFSASKGMCLEHFAETVRMAGEHLSGEVLKRFIDQLTDIEIANLERIEGELDWFTRKFDYRNDDKPWGNSKDALKRGINKLRTEIIDQ